jgi:hypothetical protein
MTELKPSMMLRYFTNENGKHYTATVLKDNTILSLKRAGQTEKVIYDSLIHWMASLPEGVTISDLDIKERVSSINPPALNKNDTITLKDIAPTYDLLRFLLTYEAYSLKNSLVSTNNTYKLQTRTYVQDAEGNLHPVKYNRYMQKLYSEHHEKFGQTLETIGFPAGADIYVSVSPIYYEKRYREWSFDKVKLPFTALDYETFYNAKFAFVTTPILYYSWGTDYHECKEGHHKLVCEYLKENDYYIFTTFFHYANVDSIFVNKLYQYLEGNLVVVNPAFTYMLVLNYNPIGLVKIPFKAQNDEILDELKYIL